jgi:RNA polymerase sigma-70 factor (ECF subfamily)
MFTAMADGVDGFIDDFDAVIAAARVGEAWAIAVLFQDLQPRLRRFVAARAAHLVDDITGEVWEAIARGIGAFEGDEIGLRAWVFTIARRRIIEHRRRHTRRKTDVAGDEVFEHLVADERPDEQVLAQLSALDAVALIGTLLTDEQAEVVLLRVVGGLDVASVAEIVGRTDNWVRVTQHRALRKLADRLAKKIGVMG